jgi:hypothetical protein
LARGIYQEQFEYSACGNPPQGLQEPSGFFTMCGGLAQEEEERLIMPAASIAANGKNSGLGRAGIV